MTKSQAEQLRHLQRPEGRLAYDVTGSGPLVVAVPGMGDLRSTWTATAHALAAAGFRVATLDIRGHGDSDPSFARNGDVETADDIEALIAELGGPALVMGNSFAGSAAVIAASRRPDLVAGTVLVSPFLRQPGSRAAVAAMRVLYRVLFARPWGAAFWTSYFAGPLHKGAKGDGFEAHVAEIRSAFARPGRLRSFRRLTTQLDHDVVPPFVDGARAVPSLTVIGALDPDFPDAAAELAFIGERLGGETMLVPDAAHYAHTQQAGTVIPRIVAFAEGLRGADSWSTRA